MIAFFDDLRTGASLVVRGLGSLTLDGEPLAIQAAVQIEEPLKFKQSHGVF